MDFSKATLLIFILLACTAPLISGTEEDEAEAPHSDTFFGGWLPVENVSDAHIVAIGKFAVEEQGKKVGQRLIFTKVVRAAEQIVSGKNYALLLLASLENTNNTVKEYKAGVYDAVVYENLKQEKTLIAFKSILDL